MEYEQEDKAILDEIDREKECSYRGKQEVDIQSDIPNSLRIFEHDNGEALVSRIESRLYRSKRAPNMTTTSMHSFCVQYKTTIGQLVEKYDNNLRFDGKMTTTGGKFGIR